MWGAILKLGIPKVFGWLKGRQEKKREAKRLNAEWELEAMKKSSTVLRIVSFVTLWGPLYHAYYLAMKVTPIEKPEDIGTAIEATFSGFPQWWTVAAVTVMLAIWGRRELSRDSMALRVADKEKARTEAGKATAERKLEEIRRNLP